MPPPPSAIDNEPPTAETDTTGLTLPPPTTLPSKINDRYYRRRTLDANLPSSQWGVAAPATSAQFKSPAELAAAKTKPKAKRWDDLLTDESKARKPSSLKGAARFLAKPGLISLGGGLPSCAYFPFSELSAHVPTSAATGFDEHSTHTSGTTLRAGKHDLSTGACIFDIATALNYGQGSGAAQLLRWMTEHTELVHRPPYADWACNATIGSTSAMDMALRMVTRRGDALLTEAYTFPTAIEAAGPMGLLTVGVAMDEEGIIPRALVDVLSGWDEWARGAKRPRVIYLVPTGQNPTGATMGESRRREVYSICQEYDVFILEDEPYYFLQMPEYGTAQAAEDQASIGHETFLKGLIPSFLSMDVDGRVLRMDSFSKVVAPGTRMGWVTASEQIVERYKMHTDCSTQGPSGFSQLFMFKLLDVHWGHGGYLDWLKHMRKEYTARRDVIVAACERHLPKDIVRWVPPRAGMFVSPPLQKFTYVTSG
jgi:aromatic amino acid aminotransferase I / 2-aminoadipate transaminase